jgi:hypothetical protein
MGKKGWEKGAERRGERRVEERFGKGWEKGWEKGAREKKGLGKGREDHELPVTRLQSDSQTATFPTTTSEELQLSSVGVVCDLLL